MIGGKHDIIKLTIAIVLTAGLSGCRLTSAT